MFRVQARSQTSLSSTPYYISVWRKTHGAMAERSCSFLPSLAGTMRAWSALMGRLSRTNSWRTSSTHHGPKYRASEPDDHLRGDQVGQDAAHLAGAAGGMLQHRSGGTGLG